MKKIQLVLGILLTLVISNQVAAQDNSARQGTFKESLNLNNPFKSTDSYTGWTGIVKLGITQPFTDINMYQYYKVIKNKNENQPMISIGAQKMISNIIGFQGFVNYGKLQGAMRDIRNPANTENKMYVNSMGTYTGTLGWYVKNGGIYFNTNIIGANGNFYFNLSNIGYSLLSASKGIYKKRISFYAVAGFGFVSFKSTIYSLKDNSPLPSNKYYYGISGKKNTIETDIPLGLGIKYKLNNKLNVGFEYVLHNVLSDKLDAFANQTATTSALSGIWLRQGAYDKFGLAQLTLGYNILGKNDKAENIEWANPFDDKIINQKTVTETDLLRDMDGDGVADLLDKEPNTPAGCRVDGSGRAMDTDGDGVIDCKDRERLSPAGYPVDQNGVAQIPDTDGDGMLDNADWEIHSPVGCKVDAHGVCPPAPTSPVTVPNPAANLSMPSIYFDTDNNIVKKEYVLELQKLAMAMFANPSMKINLIGNTDKHHSDDYNDKLGMRRAKAVADILIKRFAVPADRINLKSNGKHTLNTLSDELNRRVDVTSAN